MTQKRVVRRGRANDDIEVAVDYYLNEAGTEIAMEFIVRFEESINNIAKHPSIGSNRYGHAVNISDLRYWPITKFPFLIFYLEKERFIEIARVLHSSMQIPPRLDELD